MNWLVVLLAFAFVGAVLVMIGRPGRWRGLLPVGVGVLVIAALFISDARLRDAVRERQRTEEAQARDALIARAIHERAMQRSGAVTRSGPNGESVTVVAENAEPWSLGAQDASPPRTRSTEGRYPASSPSGERPGAPAPHRLDAPDDLTSWKEAGRAKNFTPTTVTPPWVADAAGSQLTALGHPALDMTVWVPGPAGNLVAYSGPEATPATALNAARRVARTKLALSAIRVIRDRHEMAYRPEWLPLAERVAKSYYREVDSTYESSNFDYAGEVHRAAVLFEADADIVDRLADSVGEQLRRGWIERQQRRRWSLLIAFAGAGGAFLIFVLYCLFNAGTKGHFSGLLRFVSALVLLGLGLLLYYLRMRLSGM